MDTSLDLTRRDGLPPALRVLLEDIPRESWEAHPAFGELVQFWLERHLMFRRLTQAMQADVEALIEGQMGFDIYAPRLSRYGGMLLNELHGHHQIEDHHYFPRLAKLDARIERGFELLERDHEAMDGLLHGMANGANALLQGGEAGVFADQLAEFTRLLDRHLVDEEEIIVPVILKSGFRG
ncbi:hemerythrin domain-containing protein [Pseudoruegeria sp. SHC-113]|uniref:hemerythrin domain-containing protein n=1 Tax=Pseudoruegeria sp. SHC-113 TaxID=2855439 RepID=UPI0021BB6E69|nr:hemerythrin domain-containing protein [Pseudoruegeria sp. SHC-113]MCT8162020.1 hemerythrin domain-containing protein [Pseudoruegeria sp. SHC-113]